MRSKHIGLLFVIFLILSTLSSFLWLMNDALKRNFNFTASEVLGADGSLESNQPLPTEIDNIAKKYPIKLSKTINFMSMAIAKDTNLLAHIRAIENTFPLKGKVVVKLENNIISNQAKLKADQLWIDEALKTRLEINLSDSIQLGTHTFQVSGIIVSEPARAGMALMLAPKIMMRSEDVEKTGLAQPYSKVLYQLFIQAEDKDFLGFTTEVKNKFKKIKIYSVKEGRPFANAIFNLAERYLSIFIIVIVILSGLGMMVLSQAYAADNTKMIALLRTFGHSLKEIKRLYLFGFLFFGLSIIILAMGFSVSAIALSNYFYPDYIAFSLSYLTTGDFGKIVFIQITALLTVLFGFGFFPMVQALKIPPMYLFSKEKMAQSVWPIYLSTGSTILLLLLIYISNYIDVLMLFFYLLIAATVLYLFFYSLLGLIKLLPMNFITILVESRKPQNAILATQFGILFLLTGLLWAIFNDFFGEWLSSIPKNTPNQFMINITDNNKTNIQQFWKKEGIDLALSPMLTASLKSVNNQPRSFHRALNISYKKALPEDNKKIAGIEWNNNLMGQQVISIEQNFAHTIQAKLGDIIAFDIAGQEITGKIIQIRSLQWESFKPNFYVIFPEGVLENFPKTYLTSIYLPPNQLGKTTEFLKQFPAVSIIDVNLSLSQIKLVLFKVVLALKYLIAILFALACLVYYAMLSITFFDRHYENALLRSMGASKPKLRQVILIEFGLIGALSGGFGFTGAIILAILLSKQLSITTYTPNGWFILVGAGMGAFLTMVIGWFSTYKVVHTSPLILLKEGEA
jgi:putative ABC transport system permease protein